MTNTPDYNNGLWHGWNGGECPVHPETLVDVARPDHSQNWNMDRLASTLEWDDETVAFRVTKEHKEPKDFWLCYRLLAAAPEVRYSLPQNNEDYLTVIHVREVTQDDRT